jgi:hypothetical protein
VKKIAFIADFFRDEILGGGESNDANLINFLSKQFTVKSYKSNAVTTEDIDNCDGIIIGNFVLLPEPLKRHLINKGSYIIYEHDHKYVSTRDPAKFKDFKISSKNIINKDFYNNAQSVVVLSDICKQVMELNLPKVKVHSIGCSLWDEETFTLLKNLNKSEKTYEYCIMKDLNPTKNYFATKNYCKANNIEPLEIQSSDYHDFLKQMSQCEKFIFLPTVLETFSRICAEAKMLNLKVVTSKKKIGFFSEPYSELDGDELIIVIQEKNYAALEYFVNTLEVM